MLSMMKIKGEKCRLCLSEHEKSDLTPIFTDSETSELSLAAQIMICLSLPVQEKDSLPDSVCSVCKNRVKEFYAFRETCLNTYYTLLRRGNSANDEYYGEACIATGSEVSVTVAATKTQAKKEETVIDTHHDSSQVAEESPENDMHETAYEVVENLKFEDKLSRQSSWDDSCTEEISTSADAENSINNCDAKVIETSEKLPELKTNIEESVKIIKYKCICCERLFSDLRTASLHSVECSHTDHANSSDKNSHEPMKSCENTEETNLQYPIAKETTDIAVDSKDRRMLVQKGKRRDSQSEKSVTGLKCKAGESKNFHPCEDCKRIFSSAAMLRRHSFVHTGQRPYECPLCNKRFGQIGQLNFHKNFHSNPRYRCDVCQKPFLRPSDIEKHMRTHTGEKPYDCAVCEKSFAQLVSLQQHQRIHTGDKPYVCEICGKKFSQKANKTKHVKIHKEGKKPHTCDICGRSFSDMEEMKLHREGHGGGKPRKCTFCDESFRKNSELSQHTRRCHTFEKPHKCAFCHKAFYSLYNLKQHVMIHTGQKPYSCSQCDLKFTQKGNLTKHIERKHGDASSGKDDHAIVKIENDLLDHTTDSLIIEREEIVEIENIEVND